MSRTLRLLAIIVVLSFIAIAWFWWNRPKRVDMGAYVPADSLVYLEANSLIDAASAITETDAWQRLGPYLGIRPLRHSGWLTSLIRTTGLGSTSSVLAVRAQIAFVMLDLNSVANGDTLEFKPLAALVVETHTSATRTRPTIEKMIGELATRAYGQPKLERANLAEGEFVRWIAPDGQRRIVASFDGSVVVVGNDDRAVSACLAARRGQRPSLLHQPEIEEMRARLKASEALAFGYVSSVNAARLVSEGAPLILGRQSEGAQLQKLLALGAAKVLGNVGWSTRSFNKGIEDNYFVALKPGVVARLRSALRSANLPHRGAWDLLPADTYSLTTYNVSDPAAAWQSLNAALSSQVDTLSAIVLTTWLRALLVPYGIDEPDSFLKAIKPEILTVRFEAGSERALVIAGITDANALHRFVTRRFGANPRTERVGDIEFVSSADERDAACFVGDYFLLGSPEDVRRSLAARATRATISASQTKLAALTHFLEPSGASNIVTYSKDNERVRALMTTLITIRASRGLDSVAEIDRLINDLPYAATETTLGEDGFERRTRSPFGQFGFLLSLLAPEPVRPTP